MAMVWEKGILTDMGWGNANHMVMALGSDITICEERDGSIFTENCNHYDEPVHLYLPTCFENKLIMRLTKVCCTAFLMRITLF